ncbi:hypothetical protein HY837_02280 [archaeon]|nr:hypothetical protein [archaeon]
MKKIYQIASVLALTSPLIFGANVKEVTAQVAEETQTKEDLATRVKKLYNYVLQSEKGEHNLLNFKEGKMASTRFVYENTGYALLAFDVKEREGVVTSEELSNALLIITHKLGEDQGNYTALSSLGSLTSLAAAESLSYTTKENEELLPPQNVFMTPPVGENQLTERKLYLSETSQGGVQGEEYKGFFEAEFEKTVDELLKFYEAE